MKLYRIKDWKTIYETHETRKFVALKWVPLPNKHDGLTFRQIGTEKHAADLFAAWILMVQLASKADRDHRGQLIRNSRPMTTREMALVTGFPELMFSRALAYFTQEAVGWMDVEDFNLELPLSPGVPGDGPDQTGASPENPPHERKGKERKEYTEGQAAPARNVFVPPTPAEVETYSKQIGWPMNGAAWCDSYGQKGWMVGKNKMKDWKSAVRNWKANKWHPNKAHVSNVATEIPEPENWKNYWRTKFPPEDCPDAPRYEDGEWKDVRRDHQQEILRGLGLTK